jgi:FkbM family methyltransferase
MAGAWLSIGDHEPELPFVRALLRPEDTFVDVGANIGVYSVVAAVQGARVLAFEPNGSARATLNANLALNNVADRVHVRSCALADFSGPAQFTMDLESCNHLEIDSEAKGEAVEVCQLDALVEPGVRVTLIKIDAEGFDEAVLRGARGVLERERPVLIVETWAGAKSIRLYLGMLGYEFFLYEDALRPLPPDFGHDTNLVAIHTSRIEWVQERLRTARSERRRGPRARWVFREDWFLPVR